MSDVLRPLDAQTDLQTLPLLHDDLTITSSLYDRVWIDVGGLKTTKRLSVQKKLPLYSFSTREWLSFTDNHLRCFFTSCRNDAASQVLHVWSLQQCNYATMFYLTLLWWFSSPWKLCGCKSFYSCWKKYHHWTVGRGTESGCIHLNY